MQRTVVRPELKFAIGCVFLGVLASAAMSPKDASFVGNFAFFSGTQAAVLAVSVIFGMRSAGVAGTALALASYLCLFAAWVHTRNHPDSMSWLGYVFSLPGAIAGAVVAAFLLRRWHSVGPLASGLFSLGSVGIGITLNQIAICNTLMYCS